MLIEMMELSTIEEEEDANSAERHEEGSNAWLSFLSLIQLFIFAGAGIEVLRKPQSQSTNSKFHQTE